MVYLLLELPTAMPKWGRIDSSGGKYLIDQKSRLPN
jgi:hypothetical protein